MRSSTISSTRSRRRFKSFYLYLNFTHGRQRQKRKGRCPAGCVCILLYNVCLMAACTVGAAFAAGGFGTERQYDGGDLQRPFKSRAAVAARDQHARQFAGASLLSGGRCPAARGLARYHLL